MEVTENVDLIIMETKIWIEISLKSACMLGNLYKCPDKYHFIYNAFFYRVKIVYSIRYVISTVSLCDDGGK